MRALFFGSIGSIIESSEVQREAFNRAFAENGLDWRWSRAEYQQMLVVSGGRRRISEEAKRREQIVDAEQLHQCKTRIFQSMMREGTAEPRPGVVESIAFAKQHGLFVGVVTSTSSENVNSIFAAMHGRLKRDQFDVIVDIDDCKDSKPAPDCYRVAMDRLGVSEDECVAIEDNADGVTAAKNAGVLCIATPGLNTIDHDYSQADEVSHDLHTSVRRALFPSVVAV
ncbi:MAG: HAD-IA family hydrolase [Planctomycetota bacterium]